MQARVSLARAVYSSAEVVLIDDVSLQLLAGERTPTALNRYSPPWTSIPRGLLLRGALRET